MHKSIAAPALSDVVHGRLTARRVRPKHTVTQLSVAADLGRCVRGIGFLTAARVILAVDDLIAATSGTIAVTFVHDVSPAARVGLEAVNLISATGGVLVISAFLQVTAAANVVSVIVGLDTTTASIPVVGLGSNHATATDVGGTIVGIVITATSRAAVILASKQTVATDVIVQVVDIAVTAALRRVFVGPKSTASGVWSVQLADNFLVRTTKMRARIVGLSAAAAGVVSR